jgi:prepilin-type N-terminal cleavage/methylation domain-containing protein
MRIESESRRVGFTLIELLIVITIIGLLISLILVAAADGVRRAEERATQALIIKLDTAINDRIDALLNSQVAINQTHRYLASINFNNGGVFMPVGSTNSNSDDRRAQVIAQYDYIRAELPDVFFLNSQTSDGANVAAAYPLNFGAAPYPAGTNSLTSTFTGNQDGGSFVLPLGNNYPGLPYVVVNNAPALSITLPQIPTTGMFGASFSAAGGIYKNLGYAPTGYDGVDNNANGLIDEYAEGIINLLPADQQKIATNLSKHTHKTARSEMLYAILVEGLGPLGSVFNRDEFTAREVQDTDGDGLPEFVDAWGEPLQFYRWPIYYGGASPNGTNLGTSDSQRGFLQYNGFNDTREQNPLDTNQLLVAPAWWSSAFNVSLASPVVSTFSPPGSGGNGNQCSSSAVGFMNYFHILVDPYPGSTTGTSWDRGGGYNRRAYFSRFLIVSGGPDRQPGPAQFNLDYNDWTGSGTNIVTFPNPAQTMEQNALALIYIENQAAVSNPGARTGTFLEIPDTSTVTTTYLQTSASSDDITNHNISGPSTGVR